MSKTILIVEDNALMREMYRSALKPFGARLVETQRGAIAVEVAKAERPDLIILDFILPDMTGPEIAARLKAQPETASIPILAVTNAANQADEEDLKKKGFAALLPKPINLAKFSEVVARLMPK
jgi:two-component system cell cycle response regulator DivK